MKSPLKQITRKKKFSIDGDDYEVYEVRYPKRKPHAYFVKRNGVWFTYGSKTKKSLFSRFPKLKGRI